MTLSQTKAIYGVNTRATPYNTNSIGTLQVGPNNTTTSFTDANVAYSIRAICVGSGDIFALNLKTGSSSGSTSFVAGQAQVETATAAGTITASGNASVVVTAAGMTGSPKTVSVAVTNGDTASVWAGKVRTALAADADVSALFTVGGSTSAISLTRKPTNTYTVPTGTLSLYAANDSTLNIALDNGTCTGITTAASSANTTAGIVSDGVKIYGAGEDFEGNPITTIVTLYAALFESDAGSGVIAGNTDDVTPYSTGSVIQWINSNGLTNEHVLTITPASNSDLTVTVVGKSS